MMMWPVVRSILLITTALASVFFVTMHAHVKRITETTNRDLSMHAGACGAEALDRSACLEVLRTNTHSAIAVVLLADEMRSVNGGLSDADVRSLKDIWMSRYDSEVDGSIYALAANACADGLADSCPRWLYVASWAHQVEIQDHVFSSMAAR